MTKPFDAEELKARRRAGQRILDLEDRLVEARESMRFQATHSLLTSLWNRGVIVELLLREVHRCCRERNCTAVMMCDIYHLKSVNDSLGHLPATISRRLRTSVRSYNMVGRYEELPDHADMAPYVAKAAGRKRVRIGQPQSVDVSRICLTWCRIQESPRLAP